MFAIDSKSADRVSFYWKGNKSAPGLSLSFGFPRVLPTHVNLGRVALAVHAVGLKKSDVKTVKISEKKGEFCLSYPDSNTSTYRMHGTTGSGEKLYSFQKSGVTDSVFVHLPKDTNGFQRVLEFRWAKENVKQIDFWEWLTPQENMLRYRWDVRCLGDC